MPRAPAFRGNLRRATAPPLAVEHDDVEKSVKQKDHVRREARHVENRRHSHWRSAVRVQGVAQQRRLNHHSRGRHALAIQHGSEVCRLVWRRVEHLQEWAASQVEDELWIEAHVRT
eukprot:CAMPEP_0206130070 /NCGR_PEP_ID=MMETSP1472-20131121/39064_1 /ASSEMBLY_ACC=CAM_ASM_001108 /TAXON_ID=41880 /ORGANISM="Pycnococcus provasolii, Strain RCC251" /LENGTH=115 /DNA_ID=CAMNT_0053521379 /DNA_START=306 /DNA_END=654 /DNA_ORIENTATION=+